VQKTSRSVAIRRRFKALSAVLVWRFTGTILQFVFTILVARALGAAASGYVFTCMAWSIFTAALLSLGAPAFVLREASRLGATGRVALGALYGKISLAAALAIAAIAAFKAVAPDLLVAPYDHLLLLAVLAGYAILLLEVTTSALIGIRREHEGILLRFVCPPLALCVLLVACGTVSTTPSVDVIVATYVVTVGALALVADRLYRAWAGPRREASTADAITRRRLWSINVVNALYSGLPFFVLPYFAQPREIAHFAIGYRLTSVAQTASVALGSYFSPRFARAHEQGNARSLRLLFHASQAASLALIAPLAVFLSPLGETVLDLFGKDFDGAWVYLAVPVVARLLIAGCGLTEQFLAMTHNERREVAASSVALVVLAFVGVVAAAKHGALGMSVAFYGISVVKYFATCVASLVTIYATMIGRARRDAGDHYADEDEHDAATDMSAVVNRASTSA
jgi:O-antigen/teichoic acid export membrane protein